MWVRVDDNFPEHPKVVEAGRNLGTSGRGRVVAIWQVALCYCNRNYTDGFIDEATIRSWTLYDRRPVDVALVMADAGLFERVAGGFRFHDYHDYQPTAADVKAKLQRDRDRKRAERAAKGHGVRAASEWTSDHLSERTSARIPRRSRARDPDPGPSHERQDHAAVAARISTRVENGVENRRVVRALIWRELEAAVEDPGESWDLGSLTERCKVVAARAGLAYGGPWFRDVVEVAATRIARRARRGAA